MMEFTLWLRALENQQFRQNTEDHILMYTLCDELDNLCRSQGLPCLSAFFDNTDFTFRQAVESGDLAINRQTDPQTGYAYGIKDMQWFDAASGLTCLQALRNQIAIGWQSELPSLPSRKRRQLLAELDDCIDKLIPLSRSGNHARFHLAVIT